MRKDARVHVHICMGMPPTLAPRRALHSATPAAQWWAAPSLLPPPVTHGCGAERAAWANLEWAAPYYEGEVMRDGGREGGHEGLHA